MFANGLARGLILALCITSVLLTGCESNRERKLLNSNPAAIYKVAHERMESGDYKSAIKLMEALTARGYRAGGAMIRMKRGEHPDYDRTGTYYCDNWL